MATRDIERFGALIDVAWRLNVDLDPEHTTPVIERLRARIERHVLGAKLLGAWGGGFLLMYHSHYFAGKFGPIRDS
ncbi:MAG: hypothetical protein ABSG73_12105 [Candidatus Aminicenantales bacterium]|jgi:galactokinase/mevalonate kinase-like predicted kinase